MLIEFLMLISLCTLLILMAIFKENDSITANIITFIAELLVIMIGIFCIIKAIEYYHNPLQEISLYGHTYILKQ